MDTTKVALYLRLSREDEDRGQVSQSIANQRTYLLNYAREHEFSVADIYIDDGCSGTTFDRPDFNRMLRDIESGKISTVLTKDLSRLGRDYIQTGHFLERYFPEKNIRYIAVNDNIDTGRQDLGANDLTPFLSVINDLYAKDISKKVRTALSAKKESGQFIGSTAPFGYSKDPDTKGKLVVDKQASAYIQEVFAQYLKTGSLSQTAKNLTLQKIPTPSQYRGQKRVAERWNDVMVKRILSNPTYAGNLTQNRARKISYKVSKKVNLPSEEWITVLHTHEPIIRQEEFERVQKMLAVRGYVSEKNSRSCHLLSGLVFCADCGSPMTFVKESPARCYLVCRASRCTGKSRHCTSHCIRENYVETQLRNALKYCARYLDRNALAASIKIPEAETYEQYITQLHEKLSFSNQVLSSLYKDKVKGIVSETQFINLNKDLQDEQNTLHQQLDASCERLRRRETQLSRKELVERFLSFENLDRAVLLALVKRVAVHQNKAIDITFYFQAPQQK